MKPKQVCCVHPLLILNASKLILQDLNEDIIRYTSQFIEELVSLRGQDGRPRLKHMETLEVPLTSITQVRSILDLVSMRAESDAVARLSRVVLEIDGVPHEEDCAQELLGALNLTVPEVVMTKLFTDGFRWSMRPWGA